jgi:tripartite-type tricarboxylate transporter receptor subunit TctC
MTPSLTRRTALAGGFALALRPALSRAQGAFPSRPLRLVVAFPAGGAADFLGRITAERMAVGLGQAVAVENRTGAGGNIGAQAVLQAERDGHVILLHAQGIVANPFLMENIPFNAERDFAPVAMIAEMPNLMVVSPAMGVNTVAEFIARAKARGGPVTYGSIGNGTSLHIAGALFAKATGLEMEHVPYRETSASNTDVMSGRVDVVFQTAAGAAGLVKGGQLRALATSGAARAPGFPEVPTLREAGIDLATGGWWGLFVPSAVPEERRARLEAEVIAAVRDPGIAERIVASGGVPRPMDGAAFRAFIAEEKARLGAVVGQTGMKAD